MEKKLKQQPADCIKIVLFGPESTGKTTLSRKLAEYYNTNWVPEYAREYLQDKWNKEQKTCEPHDLVSIAEGQMQLENELAQKANNVLICDTDLLETKVYSEAYYGGECDPTLEKFAIENTYDLYFLTYIDVPWEADDLRDKPNEREHMFEFFQNELIFQKRPYVLLKGSIEERLKEAIKYIDNLLLKRKIMFTEKDFQQISNKGITVDQVNSQIERLKNGMTYSKLLSAATVDRGIERFSKSEMQDYIKQFEAKQNSLSMVKFVPASGAASRMFKFLFQFLSAYDPKNESIKEFVDRLNNDLVKTFFTNLETFPFFNEVINKLKEVKPNYNDLSNDEINLEFVRVMLGEDGLNYSFFPKGLLPFHKYEDNVVSAFREHLLESTIYAASKKTASLHFTVSKKHHDYFKSQFEKINKDLSKETGVTFNISYSYQKEETETVALKSDNSVYRNEDGSILFRPAGHGALLENLDDLDYDFVFIKNIDNIVVSNKNIEISEYKKLLAGVLLDTQEKVFEYLNKLDQRDCVEEDLKIMALYLIHRLNVAVPQGFDHFKIEEKRTYLKEKFNRPIRVCGMVKNEGQPGGGPFWVKDEEGNISLQIVEFAQINFSSKDQQGIVYKATHFNPTDLVCAVKNYKGEKFNLKDYVDPEAAFITMKTQNGTDVKALELPGLWNGSMADWISIFVEVPLETFNPVKTVNDLLKPAHQFE